MKKRVLGANNYFVWLRVVEVGAVNGEQDIGRPQSRGKQQVMTGDGREWEGASSNADIRSNTEPRVEYCWAPILRITFIYYKVSILLLV